MAVSRCPSQFGRLNVCLAVEAGMSLVLRRNTRGSRQGRYNSLQISFSM